MSYRASFREFAFRLSLRRFSALVIAVVCIAAPGVARAGQCQGSIGPETSISGKTAYDPFSPADLADSYRISVRNTGGIPCAYGLRFRARSARAQLGGTLAYSLASDANASLLTDAPGGSGPLARLRAPMEAAATGQIEFQLGIARGQFAVPGNYRDTIDLELYALDESGRTAGAPLQSATLAVGYTVPRVLSVNIKGGELATTLGFGVLATGQQRSVEIQARSNQGYQLDVTSDNRGALNLTPKVPGQNWSVPYAVTLGGRPLDLSGAANLRDLPPTRPENDAGYPLTVTIGDVGQKRARAYADASMSGSHSVIWAATPSELAPAKMRLVRMMNLSPRRERGLLPPELCGYTAP